MTNTIDLRELGDVVTEAVLNAQETGTSTVEAAADAAEALGVELTGDLLAVVLDDVA